MKTSVLAAIACMAVIAAASAQSAPPYAEMQARPIKALSDTQIADLVAGRGMGLALAAELNGYPGPSHLLELADRLGLSAGQRAAVQGMLDAMKAEAIPLGQSLIAQEADLDRLFAQRTATAETMQAATEAIGATQARLRAAHLKYHLATVPLLEPQQLQRYAELRGYVNGGGEHRHRMHRPN